MRYQINFGVVPEIQTMELSTNGYANEWNRSGGSRVDFAFIAYRTGLDRELTTRVAFVAHEMPRLNQ